MVKESIFGTMDQCMMVNGQKTRLMAEVSMCGLMEGGSMESGETTTCMERASTLGKMAESMKGNMLMIGNMGTESTPGQMEDNTLDSGKTVNSMEKADTDRQMDWKSKAYGKMARESSGLIDLSQLPAFIYKLI